jgi:hypothetical protein
MDCIESILLVSATIACVITVFSATVIVGVKVQTPLADLIRQDTRTTLAEERLPSSQG